MDRIISDREFQQIKRRLQTLVVSDEAEQAILNRRVIRAPILLDTHNGLRNDYYLDLNRDYIAMQDTVSMEAIKPHYNATTPIPVVPGSFITTSEMEETVLVERVSPVEESKSIEVPPKPLTIWDHVGIIIVCLIFGALILDLIVLAALCNVYTYSF